ncbi:MAG TPA: metallopeptidase TldD-related protein [Bryobacteraceae bacterium]|nr:metallopeptidase TldD-related protein [Bryobacteraceae bacterium]
MKLRIAAVFVLGASVLWGADAVYDAMEAELARSMTLSLKDLEKPYFISYTIDDGMAWTAAAFEGGLTNVRASHFRSPEVQVRVGDYEFDNTNGGGGRGRGASYELTGFPLDDDPAVIRQYLWLETDAAYKGAVQSIAQKRASRRSVNVTDQLPDFDQAKPFTLTEDRPLISFDSKTWNERIRRVSGLFTQFPNLRDSIVTYSVTDGVHRYVNSEGTKIRQMQTEVRLQVAANIQAKDGMILRDSANYYTQDVSKMPSEEAMTSAVRNMADQLTKLAAAPVGDEYSGPILFEGVASSQLMAELLGRNLHMNRPSAAGGRGGRGGFAGGRGGGATELQGRRGVRIMPEMFSVVDDPTRPGFGHAEVDNEGVPSLPVTLVEKGVLKDFLRTRLPVQGFSESNGRALLGNSPAPTNLIITTTEKSPVSEMKQKLIDLCKQRSLPFGIIVRKLEFPLIGGPGGGGLPTPTYTYRVYPDGHEEMIRGVRLRGVDARSLKDILLAGDDSTTLNYVEGGSADVSVIAPSVLIDDLELEKVNETQPKLPAAPPPVEGATR